MIMPREVNQCERAQTWFFQFQSGCSGANRCRYHCPGDPSRLLARSQAPAPNMAGQLSGGVLPLGVSTVPEM